MDRAKESNYLSEDNFRWFTSSPACDETESKKKSNEKNLLVNLTKCEALPAQIKAPKKFNFISHLIKFPWLELLDLWKSSFSIFFFAEFPSRENPGWFKNAAGFWFNPRFGFGLMNAHALVTNALNWTTVPPGKFCRIKPSSLWVYVHLLSM